MKRFTVSAFAALVLTACTPAFAADLGGNCCSDLEERVAELEATSARKGNRKVTVTLYGQVSKSLLWTTHDQGGSDFKGYQGVQDNPNSNSRFGFTGSARITPEMTAGYTIEIGVGSTTLDLGQGSSNVSPYIRHSYWWLEHKNVGKVSVGHTSDVMDGIGQISTANTAVAVLMNTGLDGVRTDVVRFDSVNMFGAVVSASYADNRDYAFAARWAGERDGFRMIAGVGYGYTDALDVGRWLGSASVMHLSTGLFANVALGKADFDGAGTRYHVQAGIEKNFFGIGNTTLYVEHAKASGDDMLLNWSAQGPWNVTLPVKDVFGLGIVQAIDTASMDVFASLRRSSMDFGGDEVKGTAFLAGARIKF